MRNLIVFLWKHQFFVFFVILEAVSLTLLFNSYSHHSTLAFSTVNNVSGRIYSSYSSITEFFGLKNENEKLAEENAFLRNQLPIIVDQPDSVFIEQDSNYYYRTAKVVSNSVNRQNNYILINKGENDSMAPEMGVISSKGVVGIVIGTSSNYAYVMSLLHQNSRISARIKKNNHLVNVLWDGHDYKEGLVVDIPSHIELNPGDSIVTSGNSLIFPEGIMIGTIREYMQSSNQDLSEAIIEFSADFNKLQFVYIIENKMKPEADTLISAFEN
ncbi:MAG: rod shape-determining protein MreC [Bacteroidales bacterium]|jgi:rod shape-determining protein MreC|nr:rod shape-determining protein MreC [Bacteroidales bacterium]